MSVRAIVSMAVGLALLYLLFTAGAPFLLALVVAIFMEPLILMLMRSFRLPRFIAATLTSTVFTVVLIGLMVLLGVKVVAELIDFWNKVPQYVGDANLFVQDTIADIELYYTSLSSDTKSQLQNWISTFSNSISSLVTSISTSFVTFAKGIPGLFIFFIVFLVAVYLFSYSLHTLKDTFLTLFESKSRQQVDNVLSSLRRSIFGFLRSQLILSLMTYVITLVGLLFLDLKYPLAIALLIVCVDLLPILVQALFSFHGLLTCWVQGIPIPVRGWWCYSCSSRFSGASWSRKYLVMPSASVRCPRLSACMSALSW